MTAKRKNGHGGARPGAGRPRKVQPKPVPVSGNPDMLTLLESVARGEIEITPLQLRAAIAALPYTHAKIIGEGGKKEKKQKDAEKAVGKFQPLAAPKLATSDGKRVRAKRSPRSTTTK